MFPVYLELKGKSVLVVGGGPVGRRKARAARLAGARVRLVCLEPRPAEMTDPDIDWLCESYDARHLQGMALVLAAGPPEVNARVASDARSLGVWVNVASDPAASDFHLPAVLRRGQMLVAVGTAGAAPGLARRLRDRLEEQIDETFADWVNLLSEMRPVVLARMDQEPRRRELFEKLADWQWLERLKREGRAAVRQAMLEMIDTFLG